MKIRLAFATLATLIGLGGAAQAEILASPPLYISGGAAGGQFICRLFNAGLGGANVSLRQIFTNTNVAIALSADSCNVVLGSTKYCAFQANIGGNFAHSCRAVVHGADTDIRGLAQAQNGATVLDSTPMQ